DPLAPPAQPVYRVASLETLAVRLGALGAQVASSRVHRLEVTDDQGLRICFVDASYSPPTAAPQVSGVLGVVVLGVPIPDKAKAFYADLFGWEYTLVGGAGRYWTNAVPATGMFQSVAPAVHHWFCVDDLDQAKESTRALGGDVIPRDPMGPYEICDCRDDQGTG